MREPSGRASLAEARRARRRGSAGAGGACSAAASRQHAEGGQSWEVPKGPPLRVNFENAV